MQAILSIIQRYWALFIMLFIGSGAMIAVINPAWYPSCQSLVWAAVFIFSIIFWAMRKKDKG